MEFPGHFRCGANDLRRHFAKRFAAQTAIFFVVLWSAVRWARNCSISCDNCINFSVGCDFNYRFNIFWCLIPEKF